MGRTMVKIDSGTSTSIYSGGKKLLNDEKGNLTNFIEIETADYFLSFFDGSALLSEVNLGNKLMLVALTGESPEYMLWN